MNFWSVLEINPSEDVSIIKKAYAKKLKKHHPEDDPEGYQMLREAYDSALRHAKRRQLNKVEKTDAALEENHKTEPQNIIQPSLNLIEYCEDENIDLLNNSNNLPKDYIFDEYINEVVKIEQLINDFFNRVEKLYTNFNQRVEIKNWEEVLNTDLMWILNYKERVSKMMINFLVEHHHIPKDIWNLLNDNFHWDEREDYLITPYANSLVNCLFKQISEDRWLRYCYFNCNNEIDYEKYLVYRDEAFNALSVNNLKEAERYITLAYEIYPHDPDLLCMRGEYYLRMKNRKKQQETFKAAISINPRDLDTVFYQALIYYNNNNIRTAIKLCKFILKAKQEDIETRALLGKCYFKRKKWYKANRILLENLKIKASDIETKKQLRLVADQLNSRYLKYPWWILIRYNLKRTYLVLGEYRKIEQMKLKIKDIFRLLKFLLFVLLFIFIAFSVIAMTYVTRGLYLLPFIIMGVIRICKRYKIRKKMDVEP